jgi:hypothetical protein
MGIPFLIYSHFSGTQLWGKRRAWCVSNRTVLLLIERHVETAVVFLAYGLTRYAQSDVAVGAFCMAYWKLGQYLSDFF